MHIVQQKASSNSSNRFSFFTLAFSVTLFAILGLFNCSKAVYDRINPISISEQNEYRSNIILRDGTSIETDKILQPHVEEFFREAYRYNYPVDSLFANFEGIYVDDLGKMAGVTIPYKGSKFCIIDRKNVISYNRTRVVVFHELAHVLFGGNTDHCHTNCDHIFSATMSTNFYGSNWEAQKATLFLNIPHYGESKGEHP